MIETGKVVSFSYILKNADGEELDRSQGDQTFSYLHGKGELIPGLEKELEGLKVGDQKQVQVDPEGGYGEDRPELRTQIEKSRFPQDTEVEPGMQFAAEVGEGNRIIFTVNQIEGENVHVDGNHPLAGQTLYFDVEIKDVRDATEEELEHGHVHGQGADEH